MNITLSGSDLSEEMLKKCGSKAEKMGYSIELKCSDFRDLSCWNGNTYDFVASTGNSLPYVNNSDVLHVLEQMDSFVKVGGYLYLDTRNWELMLKDKPRFYLYDPLFDGENRVNTVQVWDYNPDDSMTFNILYTFEKNQNISKRKI